MGMITEELARAVGSGPHGDREFLVAVHVGSDQLGAGTRPQGPEAELFRALRWSSSDQPPRVRINGEAGSGKTSLILRGLSDAPAAGPLEALILRCGEDPEQLSSESAFAGYVINAIRAQGRFASVDLDRLAAAMSSTGQTGSAVTHSGTVGGGALPAQYGLSWTEPINNFENEPNPQQRRTLLVDELTAAAKKTRLVIVVDDTDRFVMPGADGTPDDLSITNLFRYGINFLAELPVAVIVAVHPYYDNVPAVLETCARTGVISVEVPRLSADRQPLPLNAILDKRLELGGHDERADSMFEYAALAQLQAIYFEGARHDLRAVLRLSERSAQIAAEARAHLVTVQHVQTALELGLQP